MNIVHSLCSFLKSVLQQHAWELTSDAEHAPRRCTVCGEYQEASEDEWGWNYGPGKDGNPHAHGSLWDACKVKDKAPVTPHAGVAPIAEIGQTELT